MVPSTTRQGSWKLVECFHCHCSKNPYISDCKDITPLLRKQSSPRAGSKPMQTQQREREEREAERVDQQQQDKSVTFEDGKLYLMVDPEEISIVAHAQWVKDEAKDVAFAFFFL